MKLGLTFLTAVAISVVAAPAQAAVLNANKPCYREGDAKDPVVFGGGPFTPGGNVNVTRDGLPIGTLETDAAGNISGVLTRPPIIDPANERSFTLMATDQVNPGLTGTLTRLVSQLDVNVRPTGGKPAVKRRISARGFTGGGSLYAHVVRRGKTRNVRIGALTGPCGTLSTKKRVFSKKAKNGTYRVQFDASPSYSTATYPSLTFRVRIFTVFRRRASSAGGGESWVRVD